MDFALEWHQDELQRTARAFLAPRSTVTVLRELEQSELGYDEGVQHELAELGWLELGLGGMSAGEDDLISAAILYEELGRAALPGPHFVSSVVAGGILSRAGSAGSADLLTRLLGGTEPLTVALYETSAEHAPSAIQLRAEMGDDEVLMSGRKMFVPYAAGAAGCLVLARTGAGSEELTWLFVRGDAPGVVLRPLSAISNDRLFEVSFDDVVVGRTDVIGEVGGGWQLLRSIQPRITVLQAAELLGLAAAAFEIGVEYARGRVAFGRPIASYQAIAHMCADMLADRDACRFLLYQAACLLQEGNDEDPRIAMAKAFCTRAAQRVIKSAHQILAGHGFVLEHRLSYYYRRHKVIENMFGDGEFHLDAIATGHGL